MLAKRPVLRDFAAISFIGGILLGRSSKRYQEDTHTEKGVLALANSSDQFVEHLNKGVRRLLVIIV